MEVKANTAEQRSAVADARCKFEQVLQAASRQHAQPAAAAAAARSPWCDSKPSTTDATTVVITPRFQKPKNEMMSSLTYSQLVSLLFAVEFLLY